MGIFGWNLKLFAWCSVQLLSKLPLCLKFMRLNSHTASMLGTWSEERGRTAIVMQMQKVEATQERRDEPRGSITLVFHHWIDLSKNKKGQDSAPIRVVLAEDCAHHMRLPLSNLCLFIRKGSCLLPNRESVIPASWKTEAKGRRQLQTDGLRSHWPERTHKLRALYFLHSNLLHLAFCFVHLWGLWACKLWMSAYPQ